MDNMFDVLALANKEALDYGDGLAWDNKKHKNYTRYAPRGKVFIRMASIEGQAMLREVEQVYNKLIKQLQEKEI